MWSEKERYTVKRDSKKIKTSKWFTKPLNGLQCVKNICRLKVKVIKNKKERKGEIRCGGTHL